MTEIPQQQDTRPGGAEPGASSGFDRDALRDFDRLRRSTTDRKIAGVAGGLGRHLNIDPTVLRVLFVVLVFFGGAGLLMYGAAWLLVPEEGSDEATISTSPSTRTTALVVVGVVAALLLIGDSWGGFGFPWPLALVALVLVLVLVNRDRSAGPRPGPPTDTWSGRTPPPAMGAAGLGRSSTGWVGDTTGHRSPADDTAGLGPASYDAPPAPPAGPGTWTSATPPQPPYRPSRADRGPRLFGFTLAFVALALGLLGLYDATAGGVVDAAYPALALAVVGVMLVWGAFAGRPGGLILLGLVAALALAVTSRAQEYGWEEPDHRTFVPLSAAALPADYDFFAGSTTVDLTRIADLDDLDDRSLDIRAEAGEVRVIVPEGLTVDVDARIGVGGEIDVDGTFEEGRSPQLTERIDGGDGAPDMTIDIDLTVGTIDVQQEAAA
jgi:phage shock protein PspC (stress-responsive transcriptional regulator)